MRSRGNASPGSSASGLGHATSDALDHTLLGLRTRRVGIDLGLKDLATLSTGEKVEVPKFYRKSEERLATVQRARKTRRARAIHAKIVVREE